MQYDVLIPGPEGVQAIAGIIPNSDQGLGQVYDPTKGTFEKAEIAKKPAEGMKQPAEGMKQPATPEKE
jgi:hypothetical protein